MTKNEIIEKLYQDGKITFQEAMTLSAQDGIENASAPELNLTDSSCMNGTRPSRESIQEGIVDDFLYEIVEELYDEECPNENLAFDSQKCVEAMDANDWKWFDTGVPTKDQFKERLRDMTKRVIDCVLKNYRENYNEENDYYAGEETGGISVEGWITKDKDGNRTLEIQPMFILEQSRYFLEEDKLKEIL